MEDGWTPQEAGLVLPADTKITRAVVAFPSHARSLASPVGKQTLTAEASLLRGIGRPDTNRNRYDDPRRYLSLSATNFLRLNSISVASNSASTAPRNSIKSVHPKATLLLTTT